MKSPGIHPVDIDALFAEADMPATSHLRRMEISNILARDVMGWSVQENDAFRLWHEPSGSPVLWLFPDGVYRNLCMMPFRADVNTYDQEAFSPAHNYHSNIVDWRCVVRKRFESRNNDE